MKLVLLIIPLLLLIIVLIVLAGKSDKKGAAKGVKSLNDFAVEYAKSNRSTCKGCEQKIEKVTRVTFFTFSSTEGSGVLGVREGSDARCVSGSDPSIEEDGGS